MVRGWRRSGTSSRCRPGEAALLVLTAAGTLAWAALAQTSAMAAEAKPAASGEPTFDINAIDVEGNSLLDEAAMETAVYPFEGPDRSRQDVSSARKALEDAYHAKGYQSVVVEVPRQTVAGGVVKLHVIETPVGRLRVIGAQYHTLAKVREAVPALAEGRVPDFQAAQAQIAEANRLPARQITPVVRAGEVPGTIDVDLKVADQEPLHGSLEVNDEKSPYTTPLRLTANLSYDNLWQLGHSVSLTYEVAPQNRSDAEVYAGSYAAPLWNTPFSLLLFGFNSNSDIAALGGVDVIGRGHDIGLRGIYQEPTFGSLAQSLSFGIDYKSFAEIDRVAMTTQGQPAPKAVSYWPLAAVYTLRRQTEATTTLSLGVTANLRGLGESDAGFRARDGRLSVRANFIHLNLDAEHVQPLPFGLQGEARVSGQITNVGLVSSEQLALGGFTSVRGYDEAEFLGDDGAYGSLELRSPLLLGGRPRLLDQLRTYVFYDAGDVRVLGPAPEQTGEDFLDSAGAGARFRLLDHLSGDLFAAFPLKRGPVRTSDRAYTSFSLKAEF